MNTTLVKTLAAFVFGFAATAFVPAHAAGFATAGSGSPLVFAGCDEPVDEPAPVSQESDGAWIAPLIRA